MIVTTIWSDLQRSGVTECLSKFAFDFILWRKVKLLEKLRRDGDTTGGPNMLQSQVLIHAIVKVLVIVSTSIPVS